jgi:hypothetical protein
MDMAIKNGLLSDLQLKRWVRTARRLQEATAVD